MKLLKILLVTIVTLFTTTGCCWTDHSKVIKEVAEPMLKQLDTFYKKNKRHPNKEERDEMLLASGCSKVKNEECSYKWKKIRIDKSETSETNKFYMGLNYGDTYCYFGVYNNGELSQVSCDNSPCIDWGR